ncbi:MAG: four-carbon acid sugar kinase family protein [Synechococcus sp. ELA057]
MQQEVSSIDGRPGLKIVVIDDDPTGSQAVHSCPLLLRWDQAALLEGLKDPSPLLFLLANTRALAPDQARQRVLEICRALAPALAQAQRCGWIRHWLLVSRGDSTLRSHFPIEVDAITAELGPFDATLLVPAFLEGGRTTVNGVHLLDGVPVHRTAFARDRLFAYDHSDLRAWVEQKSGGRIPAAAVQHLSLETLEGPPQHLRRCLAALRGNPIVAVDAERPAHLAALAAAVRQLLDPLAAAGSAATVPRRFLVQSAASLLGALADLPPQPRDPAALAALRRRGPEGPMPGLMLVGSHVPLADDQLQRLLADPGCAGVELSVPELALALQTGQPSLAALESDCREQLERSLAEGRTPVLYTSRGEQHCASPEERLALGMAIAALMARVAGSLAERLGYLISKGGITTHTLLADGLQLAGVQLQGQLLPGLSLVLAGPAALPVITFPGNLGDAGSLWQAWRLLEAPGSLSSVAIDDR